MQFINSLLHIKEIEKIMLQYFRIEDVKCHLLRSYRNEIYVIASFGRKYIFKIYNALKPKEDVVFETSYMDFLNRKETIANMPVKAVDNKYYIELEFPEGKRYAVLFEYNNGVELDYNKASDALIYGKSVAKLHLASKDYKPSYSKETNVFQLFIDATNKLELFFTKYKNEQWVYLDNYLNKVTGKITTIDTNKMLMGYIHADLHGGNYLLHDKEMFFYDFEYSGFGLICYELSVFRWSTLIGNREDQWTIFLKGYRSLIDISDHELHHSLVMVCIRDALILANTVSMADKFGISSIHNYYIQNRLQFIKKMTNILQI
ncbi:MAG: phosphotransferase [Candidatus Marinimicrobia bacterium]|jgi:Ser/Thr protein kinase RdoA (MazF antagonist)|nr:phosphotransferase [bacterium]MBT6217905.1 phosphotransferase [Candidatus Neomarinimicrobiota bacterium]MBT7899928.1 phosphotransferase [Candidatus Neomarinimicrobiota bacterium]